MACSREQPVRVKPCGLVITSSSTGRASTTGGSSMRTTWWKPCLSRARAHMRTLVLDTPTSSEIWLQRAPSLRRCSA